MGCSVAQQIVLGVGNIGDQYHKTRHNYGFMVVDALAKFFGVQWIKDRSLFSYVAKIKCMGKDVWLVKPTTFVNNISNSVKSIISKAGLSIHDCIFVYDDAQLDCGKWSFRKSSNTSGHNALRNIAENFEKEKVNQVRMGIGKAEDGELAEYVLSSFTNEEFDIINNLMNHVVYFLHGYLCGVCNQA